ncbi:MAG: amino acid ABC transporter substrate-binding protein [Francisellaceae bacterium]|jgi:general L-amino acid transport system substrate-binding protein|nr:amino acid ABC transporter substrate-binding protein [Francisellaceae bacterium]
MYKTIWKFVTLVTIFICSPCFAAKTIDEIKERGYLICGVSQGLPGFSFTNDDGSWDGLDVDICRATATAIFKDPTKVRFRPLSAKERFTALQSGEIDLLSRNTTWTFHRDAALGLEFTNIVFYDGQGFLVPKELSIKSFGDLSGATFCTQSGTTTELNLADYCRANNIPYQIITFDTADEVVSAYQSGRCDVFTSDKSGLAARRTSLKNPDAHEILDLTISKEPLGPSVRQYDSQWADLVRWVVNGLITAEELGITKENVNVQLKSKNPKTQRLLGVNDNFGISLGVDKDFMVNVISSLGNYGEIYTKNLGPQTPMNIPRGQNALWENGGLLYSPPFR